MAFLTSPTNLTSSLKNSEVVSQAASVLSEYGSADAEKALWKRFEKWHEAMQSRSKPEEKFSVDEERIEKRVRDLCLSDNARQEVEGVITNWDPQVYVNTTPFLDDDTPRFGVANREIKSLNQLKDKLLQFPGGTLFKLKIAPNGDDQLAQDLVQQIKTFLEEHGMKWKLVE